MAPFKLYALRLVSSGVTSFY